MNQEIIKRLKNLRMIDTEIMSKRQEIAELRSKILKGQQYSDMPKVEKLGNGNEYLNIKIIDDTRIINEDINKLYKERQVLTTAINNLDELFNSIKVINSSSKNLSFFVQFINIFINDSCIIYNFLFKYSLPLPNFSTLGISEYC
ncbi:hypothetical protein [Streptococcus equi]|uniref:hypothetical protein n=1 Tax=Streptococcus equi TaxID=1336 RepID=UPI001E44A8F7|nr:hypothetical protein [Streptococcus equi]